MERKLNPALTVVKEGWEGNTVIDGRFHNGAESENISFGKILKWRFSSNPQRDEKRNDTFRLQVSPFDTSVMPKNSITWLGHSSFLIDANGVRMITDPCFFDLPSGRRKAALPCTADSLTSIDYLLVSHDHRDHFDRKSVEILAKNNPEMEALIPLGGGRLFGGKKLSGIRRQEAGWYQEYVVKEGIRIIFLPAKHWGRRGLNDFNTTLWGSFLIIAAGTKIFFAGDSAYDEDIFKEIRDLFGDIDICMLPVGAYSPPFIMKQAHINPEEAVQTFLDLGGKRLIPMHYGTYILSDEPPGEPLKRLRRCAAENRIEQTICELTEGQSINYELRTTS